MKRSPLFIFPSLLVLLAGSAPAQTVISKVPTLLNYQGYVTDAAGKAIGRPDDGGTGPVNLPITFRFWNSASESANGNRLFAESQTVTINNGDFSVLIGDKDPTGETVAHAKLADVFASSEVFLGITVDLDNNSATADTEISPRQQIVTSAFAFRAKVAEEVIDGAITSSKLAPGAVGKDQLGVDSVTSDQIKDSAVSATKIGPGQIGETHLADNAVTSEKIKSEAVTSASIKKDTIEADDINKDAVTTSEIKDDTITASDIKEGAVTTSEIKDGTIRAADIESDAVTSDRIKDFAITASDIKAGAVTRDAIKDGTIRAADIESDTVTSDLIKNGTIHSHDLGAGTVITGANTPLRIVRGKIGAVFGSVISGVGFTSERISLGRYRITFSPGSFTDAPAVTGNSFEHTATVSIISLTKDVCEIRQHVPTQGERDSDFCFIAIGRRGNL